MATTAHENVVPLFIPRLISYTLAIAAGVVSFASTLNAQHKRDLTKDYAQTATQKLTPGVSLTIDTTDIDTAGTVEAVAQLGLALLGILCLVFLLLDSRKRTATTGHKTAWSSKTLILQIPSWFIAVCFSLATSIVTTLYVAKRQAQVSSILPNGSPLSPVLVQAFQTKLGISPVYKEQDYLRFMAASGWFGFVFSLISLIITIIAWRRHHANTHVAPSRRTLDSDSLEKN